jgi:hypothetical protein
VAVRHPSGGVGRPESHDAYHAAVVAAGEEDGAGEGPQPHQGVTMAVEDAASAARIRIFPLFLGKKRLIPPAHALRFTP